MDLVCKHCNMFEGDASALARHIRNQHSEMSIKEYAFKYYSCVNVSDEDKHTINPDHIFRIKHNTMTYEYQNGILDLISNTPTIAKNKQYFSSYIRKRYDISLFEYANTFLRREDEEEDGVICKLCNTHEVDRDIDIDFDAGTYSITNDVKCNTDECKRGIFKRLFPHKEYNPKNYSKIGCMSEYISLTRGITVSEAKKLKTTKTTVFDCSMQGFIDKYGEVEGLKRFKERGDKISSNGNMSFNYHLKKCGGDMDLAVKSRHDRVMSIANVNGNSRRSTKENVFVQMIRDALPNHDILQTYMIRCNDDKSTYFVDLVIKDVNIIIEYFGDYWHANPKKYKSDHLNKSKNKTAAEIWSIDEKRVKDIEELGYTVIIIWEDDFDNNSEDIVRNIVSEVYKNANK